MARFTPLGVVVWGGGGGGGGMDGAGYSEFRLLHRLGLLFSGFRSLNFIIFGGFWGK